MNALRSETRTEHGWHSFDRVAGLISLGLVLLLLAISLIRGSLGGSESPAPSDPPLRSDRAAEADLAQRAPTSGASNRAGAVSTLPPKTTEAVPAADQPAFSRTADGSDTGSARGKAGGRDNAGISGDAIVAAPGATPPSAGTLFNRIPTAPVTADSGSQAAPGTARDAGSGLVKPILEIRANEGRLTIDGIIGDEATRKAILQAALSKFGMRNINDRLAVSAGVAHFDWSGRPEEIIDLVGEPQRATSVKVDGSTITLSGVLPEFDDKEARGLAAQQLFGASARVLNRIQVGTAGTAPAGGAADRLAAANTPGAIITAQGIAGTTSPRAGIATDKPAEVKSGNSENASSGQATPAPAPEADSEAGEPSEDGALVLTAEVPKDFKVSECARVATGISIPFRSGSADLTSDVQAALRAVSPCLERREYIVGGHTDGRGSEIGNLILSQARAQAAVDYLAELGVPAERLIAKGYGESRPVDTNRTEEGRARNRRIDFRFAK